MIRDTNSGGNRRWRGAKKWVVTEHGGGYRLATQSRSVSVVLSHDELFDLVDFLDELADELGDEL